MQTYRSVSRPGYRYSRYTYNSKVLRKSTLSNRVIRSRVIRDIFTRIESTSQLVFLLVSIITVCIFNDFASNHALDSIIAMKHSIPMQSTLAQHQVDIVTETYDDYEIYQIHPGISKRDIDLVTQSNDTVEVLEEDSLIEEIESEVIVEDIPIVEDIYSILEINMGNDIINLNDQYTLTRYDLPDKYYPGIDYSSFQPYMSYKKITNTRTPAYAVSHSENAYTDEYGLRRYKTTDDQFTIDGQDDYIVALGTFYKEKGTCGSRYLIVTTTGMYTVITGDEKSDSHTDQYHMFTTHKDGSCAGMIEWIVDVDTLESTMKTSGTITSGPVTPLQGEIIQIYGIN